MKAFVIEQEPRTGTNVLRDGAMIAQCLLEPFRLPVEALDVREQLGKLDGREHVELARHVFRYLCLLVVDIVLQKCLKVRMVGHIKLCCE